MDSIPNIRDLHWARREDYVDLLESSTANEPSRFLNLPREIRDLIYGYFLEAHRLPPHAPGGHLSGFPIVYRLVEDERGELEAQRDICYTASIPQTSIHSLLHTNHSIRSEVLQLVDKRNRIHPRLPAELDLMVTGYVFYPFWTRLPVLPSMPMSRSQVPTATTLNLSINLRIFSAEAFRANDGWPRQPGVAFRSLLTLLNQFLTCGPAFTHLPRRDRGDSSRRRQQQQQQNQQGLVIDTLTLRLRNHDIYTARMFPPAVYETVRMCKALAKRADLRPALCRVRILVEDPEGRFGEFEGREWAFEVLSRWNEDEMAARISEWENRGFWLRNESARFDFG